MPFTLYNQQDIQTILHALNITTLKLLNTKRASTFDLYCHPKPLESQSHNFLKDHIEYLLIKREHATNRRVAFLETDFALVVECSNFDVNRAKKVLHHMETHQLNTVEAVLLEAKNQTSFQHNLQHLYNQINAVFFTIKKPSAIISKMGEILSKTYSLPTPVIPLVHMIDDTTGVDFVRLIQMQLQQGNKTLSTSLNSASRFHHYVLLHWLEHLHNSEPSTWNTITSYLEIILKFQRLQCERQALDGSYQTATGTDALLLKDKQNKLLIFNESFSTLQDDLGALPHNFLAEILSRREAPDEVLAMLLAYKKEQQADILAWEEHWQPYSQHHAQPWGQWFRKKIGESGHYIYDNSFMALGSNLFSWAAKHAATYIPWQSPMVKSSRNLISFSVKLAVFFTTLSPQLANQAGSASKELLTEEGLIELAKILGNTSGAIANTSLGGYYLLRAVLMSSGTQRLRDYLKAEKIDLETATAASNDSKLPSLINLLRINYLMIALINGISANDPRFVIQAISGMAGSVAYERMGGFVLAEFSDDLPFKLTPEDKRYIQFFLSLFGMEAGNALSNTYFKIMDKLTTDEAALQRFKEFVMNDIDVSEFHAEAGGFSDLPWSLIAEKRGVNLFWKDSSGRYESACEMSVDGLERTATIDCESPIMLHKGITS